MGGWGGGGGGGGAPEDPHGGLAARRDGLGDGDERVRRALREGRRAGGEGLDEPHGAALEAQAGVGQGALDGPQPLAHAVPQEGAALRPRGQSLRGGLGHEEAEQLQRERADGAEGGRSGGVGVGVGGVPLGARVQRVGQEPPDVPLERERRRHLRGVQPLEHGAQEGVALAPGPLGLPLGARRLRQ